MYMREMGTVDLLTRESEIEIARRIEDGLKHMVQAIAACPTTIAALLAMIDKVEKDELSVDDLVDGLIDADVGLDDAMPAEAAAEDEGVTVVSDSLATGGARTMVNSPRMLPVTTASSSLSLPPSVMPPGLVLPSQDLV
jgi:hypothetical protein